jgi:hypothetical protein
MNATFPQRTIEIAMERDAASASAEYLAEFRTDVQAFVERGAVEACVFRGVYERAPISNVTYSAFVDPSGGARDAMTMAVAHLEDNIVVLDAVRSRKPPFSPADVVAEFAAVLASYNVTTVKGDRYAGEWPVERFREYGITYEPAAKTQSHADALYLANFLSRRTRPVFSKCVVRNGLLDQGYGFTAVARRRKQSLVLTPSR